MNNLAGQTIKGYDLQERIGAGGFGAVYRAVQSTVGREVAVKIILPGLASKPDFIRRFESEAHLIARLEHPYIVPLYDYWRDPDGAYLVMRWLRGGSLHEMLKKQGAFSVEETVTMMEQITQALHTAHRSQVIHRDIKPANILLDDDGNAYLADFGIAKDHAITQGVTEADAVVGSPDYLAPEQARSEPVTPQTDIYSLGVVLYEMLVGEHPFPKLSPIEQLFKHLNTPLPDITTLDESVRDGINLVIQRATAKNPQERFKDVLELAQALRSAARVGTGEITTSIVELLTPREQEVLQLMINGKSNKEIADALVVEVATIKWYNKQIYRKLNVRSRVQAIVKARELELVLGKQNGANVTTGHLPEPENPYKGLRAFQAADAQDFFGREKLTQKLLSRLYEDVQFKRFLAIVGPSGSGKSSVVRAGLIPALWRGELKGSDKWYIVDMLPGDRPLDELEVALLRVAGDHNLNIRDQLERDANGLIRAANLILPDDGSELLLVIDQFEEVFTLVEKEADRQHFLNLLLEAVTRERSRVRVVVTLRADYYDRPLQYPDFGELMRSRVETVLPLGASELERAIREPALMEGVQFEDGLVSRIVTDVNYQPGALPLLQYALTELFERRKGRTLTQAAYLELGGTGGALAKRADELYLEYDEAAREQVRQLFLRLVTLGEGAEDTRRRVTRSELLAISAEGDVMDDIIDTYAASRLLSLDHDPATRTPTVEVAHEAMLREWDRLRAWLNESREDIRQQRIVAQSADAWKVNQRDASYLLGGTRLEQVEKWSQSTELALTPLEREFIEASIGERLIRQKAETERQAREVRLEQRSRSFLRGLVAVLLVATVVALGLTAFAVYQSNVAQRNEREARSLALTSAAQLALNEGDIDQAIAQAEAALALGDSDLARGVIGRAAFAPQIPPIFRDTETFLPDILSTESDGLNFVLVAHFGADYDIPFSNSMIQGMQDACDLVNASCQWIGEWDHGWEKMAVYWDEALAMNPDGIGTTIMTIEAIQPYVERAAAQGIPVVAFNSSRGFEVTSSVQALLYVGVDEYINGAANAQRVFDQAKADGVTIQRGVCPNQAFHDSPTLAARCAGVQSVFDDEGVPLDQISFRADRDEVVELGAEDLAAYFSEHPETNAIFMLGPAPAAALNLYIQRAGIQPGELYATTHDTDPNIFQMIKDGYLLQAIDQQPYLQGFQTVISLYIYSQYGVRASGYINTSTIVDQTNVDNVIRLGEFGYR